MAPEEVDACAALLASSDPWLTLGRGLRHLLPVLKDPHRERFAAWEGKGLAGVLVLNLHGAFVGYVQILAAAPSFRGRGVGRELLRFAEARIFREHRNVFLCVSDFNTRARAFYEREGYACVGEIPDYVVAGHSELLMRKTRGPMDAS
ncbi:MAG: GNAT family N-acetyltransferase [Acidobacteria bacterium]|nr:GNAT family N-acetyltransferase [Acidobacteriota bacterium]